MFADLMYTKQQDVKGMTDLQLLKRLDAKPENDKTRLYKY